MNFADICCGINKLKIKQHVLEKNELDFIKSIRSNYGISLDDDFYTPIITREEELNALQKDIFDNLESLKTIKSTINRENLEHIDVDTLKNTILAQENDTLLLKFRVDTELGILIKQENDLNLDLVNFEMKIEDAVNNKLGVASLVKNAIEYKIEHHEIKDFATFVNTTGGHEGGWNYDDHLVFIRNYNKIKNTKKLVQVLHNILPDISEEQILSHISWYKKYLDLRSKQKQVLEKWREDKNKKPSNFEAEQKFDNKSLANNNNNNNLGRGDEVTMRAKLKQWKKEKQEKLQQESENIKKENLKYKLIQKDKELQNLEVKKQVTKWKTLKTAQEKADKLEKDIQSLKQKEKKISITNKLIRDFQSQDNIYLVRRINNLKLKHSKVSKRTFALTNKKRGRRDPQRIYKSTQQWVSRVNKQDLDQRVFFGTIAVKDIPKLGTPTWRSSMNE